MNQKEILWEGYGDPCIDENRPLSIKRPCPCGCDGKKGAGYITGSIGGKGVTIWIESKEAFKRLNNLFEQNRLSNNNTTT